MELYIHIPYCVSKCNYCDFLSFPCGREGKKNEEIKKYIEALEAELNSYIKKAAEEQETVSSVFIGGGTPSILEPDLIGRILAKVNEFNLEENAEFTIECNPGTLTEEKLFTYKRFGVNRISLGLQTTDVEELGRLGRIHTYEEFLESYKMVRKAGFSNVNIDLISSLPGQSEAMFKQDLIRACELSPEHISVYSLIIEEGTPFFELYRDKEELFPSEEEDRSRYHLTGELLKAYGYGRYEISNYSKPSFECRHNLGYWVGTPYIGAGLGAASYINNVRYKNTDDMQSYLSNPVNSHVEIEKLTREDLISEYIILHLRLVNGLSKSDFKARFGCDIYELYANIIKKYVSLGFMADEPGSDGRIYLSEEGLNVSNTIMSEFI